MGRALLGLFVGALVFGVAFATFDYVMAVSAAPDGKPHVFVLGKFMSATFLAWLFAVTVLIIIGRPTYLILARHGQWYVSGLAGFVIAFTIDFFLTLALRVAQTPPGEAVFDLGGLLVGAAQISVFGAVAGLAYWLVARPDHLAAPDRSDQFPT
jgi:hypothetical protein